MCNLTNQIKKIPLSLGNHISEIRICNPSIKPQKKTIHQKKIIQRLSLRKLHQLSNVNSFATLLINSIRLVIVRYVTSSWPLDTMLMLPCDMN